MQTVGLLAAGAVMGLAASVAVNNLEPVPDFQGKNRLLWRVSICLTFLPVAIAALTNDKVIGQTRVACWVGVGAIAVALLYDIAKLTSAIRAANARRRDPAVSGTATSVGYAPELRAKLLAEMSRQVEERLKSAYGEQALVNLQMAPEPDAVEGGNRESNVFLVPTPKQYVENFKDDRVRLAQSEETVLDTFDDPAILGQLLILGAPGSGKTTTLLRLAKDLLVRADENGLEIPYIFELSAWRDDRQDIASWLMAQLALEHNIKEVVSREWILNGQLLPLLDGLDELATDRRQACIRKINEFVTSRLGRKVVVCCRTKVYEASEKKLDALNGALRIQPLDVHQIRDYFERVNPEIWEALQDDAGLGELLKRSEKEDESALLQIPLFLQILAISYQPGKEISSKSELLDAYIARRLSSRVRNENRRLARSKEINVEWAYKTVEKEPTEEITSQYLCWLAHILEQTNSPNVFLIEKMQPTWLDTKRELLLYRLIVFLSILPLLFIASVYSEEVRGGMHNDGVNPFEVMVLSSIFMSLVLSCGFTIFGEKIEVVENLRMSSIFSNKQDNFAVLRKTALFVLVFSLLAVIVRVRGFVDVSVIMLLSGASFVIMFSLFYWLELSKEAIRRRTSLNQGIFASAKNSLLTTLASYAAFTLSYWLFSLSTQVLEGEGYSLKGILSGSFLLALLMGLYFGGFAVIQHLVLRFLLHRQGRIPHNYAKFLKYTTERRLTQQIGGSFRFIHRELLDHFAAMHDSTLEDAGSKSVAFEK